VTRWGIREASTPSRSAACARVSERPTSSGVRDADRAWSLINSAGLPGGTAAWVAGSFHASSDQRPGRFHPFTPVGEGAPVDPDPRSDPQTASQAHAVHAHPARVDGMVWISRQYDIARALVLFGDRAAEHELTMATDAIPMTLALGRGLDTVLELADQANITIT
jgi:hypothetical protein